MLKYDTVDVGAAAAHGKKLTVGITLPFRHRNTKPPRAQVFTTR